MAPFVSLILRFFIYRMNCRIKHISDEIFVHKYAYIKHMIHVILRWNNILVVLLLFHFVPQFVMTCYTAMV